MLQQQPARSYPLPDAVEQAIGAAASYMRRPLDQHGYAEREPTPGEPNEVALDPVANAAMVKHAASLFGAALVGVCVPERQWFRSEQGIEEMSFTEENIRAVVIAVRMDSDAFDHAPSKAVSRASTMGYMQMALVAGGVAEFIRNLGYRAFAHGNSATLSPLLAEKAGLGEVGYHCVLITEEFGPRVRLCKVFTDMPLALDTPKLLGVRESCESCQRCLEACPVDAIQPVEQPKMLYEQVSVDRYWRVDGRLCRDQWNRVGSSCGICLSVCPGAPHSRLCVTALPECSLNP